MMKFNVEDRIGIIGSGSMGSGIAQVAAEAGHCVFIYDNNPKALERSRDNLEKLFEKLVNKGKRTAEQATDTLNRISFVHNLLDLRGSKLIIEAIIEDLSIKKNVIDQLSDGLSSDCIIATNTSSLSVTAIASAAKHPENIIGLHFFNPAPLMKLVEVVPAIQTKDGIAEACLDLMTKWGKTPVTTQDTPGFIVNRVARPFYSEAFRIYDEGIAQPHEIDEAMEELGFRMGPFYLTDFIGHNTNFAVTTSMFNAYWGEPRYKPSFAQKRLVDAGYWGRKAKKGFYDYDENLKPIRKKSSLEADKKQDIQNRILALLINEAFDALHFNIGSAEAIDNAMTKGVNYPKGLIAWAEEIGLENIVQTLDHLYDFYHEERYRVSPGLRKKIKQV